LGGGVDGEGGGEKGVEVVGGERKMEDGRREVDDGGGEMGGGEGREKGMLRTYKCAATVSLAATW